MKSTLSSLSISSLSLITLTFFALSLRCQAETSPYSVGGLAGVTIGNSTTQFTFGAEGQYQITPPWSIGAEITYYNAGSGIPGVSYSSSFTTLTAQGLYDFKDVLEGLHAGAQLGLGFTSTNIPGVSGSTNFIIGPTAEYNYMMGNQISVGGETTLYFNTLSGSSPILQILAAVKYWF